MEDELVQIAVYRKDHTRMCKGEGREESKSGVSLSHAQFFQLLMDLYDKQGGR